MAEQVHSRVALAKEQLDVALVLFLDHQSYAASITLAGAAEEVLGKALSSRGGVPAIENSYRARSAFIKVLHGVVLDKKTFIAQENNARDALKHLQEDKGPCITLDLETAACWMLVRALGNAMELGIKCARESEFDGWFYENIIGI